MTCKVYFCAINPCDRTIGYNMKREKNVLKKIEYGNEKDVYEVNWKRAIKGERKR